jgi:hypothetical protein
MAKKKKSKKKQPLVSEKMVAPIMLVASVLVSYLIFALSK